MSNSKEIVKINPEALAYVFMHHNYTNTRVAFFSNNELSTFCQDFVDFVNYKSNSILVNENEEIITHSNSINLLADKIVENHTFEYVQKDYMIEESKKKTYLSFESDSVEKLRNAYLKADSKFKNLAIDFLTEDLRQKYTNQFELKYFDDRYKKHVEHQKTHNDKKEKTFDA